MGDDGVVSHPKGELPMTAPRKAKSLPQPAVPLDLPVRSYSEVGRILGISPQAVRQGEQRAFRQLAEHPLMKRLFRELE